MTSSSPIPGTPTSTLAYHAESHTGNVRPENQDRWSHIPLPQGDDLFLVADGMGGAQAGSIAAELTVRTFQSTLHSNTALAPPTRLKEALQRANQAVFQQGQAHQDQQGMGSTAVAIWIDPTCKIASGIHVGDSRAYLFRNMELMRLTRDDSAVERLVESHRLTPAQARQHVDPNLLVRALGTHGAISPEIQPMEPFALHPGDLFLLCSDGLTAVADDEDLAHVLAAHQPGALNQTCQNLLYLALQRGGPDNVTVLLVQVPGERIPAPKMPRSGEVPVMGMGGQSQAVMAYQRMTHPSQLPLTQEQLAMIEEDNRKEHTKQRVVLYATIALIVGLLTFLAFNVKLVKIKRKPKARPVASKSRVPARTHPGQSPKKKSSAKNKAPSKSKQEGKTHAPKEGASQKKGQTKRKKPVKTHNRVFPLPFAPSIREDSPTQRP